MVRLACSRALGLALILVSPGVTLIAQQPKRTRHEDLVKLFAEWREFQHPKVENGVPDYSGSAMAVQHRGIGSWLRYLSEIDTTGWTTGQQVDWHIVRAEMNGLDFDHRVIRPWAKNPAFYVTVFPDQSDQPAREGHNAYAALELWSYTFPLSPQDASEVSMRLRAIPEVLRQAKMNLRGTAKDLWMMGIRSIGEQSSDLNALAAKVQGNAALLADVTKAREATDEFRAWLEQQAPTRTGPSGVGIANYDWYLKNVQLVPYTWQDQVTLMQRELGRSRAALALEEVRNRSLPPLEPVASNDEWQRRFNAGVTEYMAFFRDRKVLTVRDYMEPALRARAGRFFAGPREFFSEVSHRDAIVMRTHDFHWIDLARMAKDPHPDPIRRGPLLYNIFTTRTEGLATAMEEMMANAGFLDTHPRGKELIYILIAQRAARALGDLMMHANRFTIDQAVKFATSETPRGWLREDGATVWGEQHLYLQQPAYGTCYLIGKIQIDQLLSDRARQLGDKFTLQSFMDEFTAVGLIPMSLVRWEMLGEVPGFR